MTKDYAARARALVGTRFRAQGRGSEGLDCVGLTLATYGIDGGAVRRDYALRGAYRVELERELQRFFRPVKAARRGDLMLCAPAADQLHLAVKTEAGFVHAHAGLRRVVETPGAPDWPVVAVFRRRARIVGR